MRAAIVALLVLYVGASGGCTGKPKPAPTPSPGGGVGVRVTIAAAKPEFSSDEPVRLHVQLTNLETRPCKILQVPDAAPAILDARRDGKPQASVSYDLTSERSAPSGDRPALETSTLDASNQSNSSYWPVDEPGRYDLAVRYLPAPVTGGLCGASGDPVTVSVFAEVHLRQEELHQVRPVQ